MNPNPEIQTIQQAPKPSVEISTQPSKTIDQIKRTLLDPREISKKYDQTRRIEEAQNLKAERHASRTLHSNISANEGLTAQIDQQASVLTGLRGEKNAALMERMDSTLVRAKKLLNTTLERANIPLEVKDRPSDDLKAEVSSLDTEIDELSVQSMEAKTELARLKQQEGELPDPRKTLEAYYEKMETHPLTNEEKRELLKPEVLSQLSTEEYIALWKRLNPHFLAHVTRQGFRDHTGGDMMVSHDSGYGELVNGFTDMMANGRSIFPPLARVGLINRDEATVNSFLSNFITEGTSEDQARKMFMDFLTRPMATAPTYPDITATHLAAQIVSDDYYGGERGSEVFFVYPTDVIASQYPFAFNGLEKDFTKPQSETKWNDVFIWTDPNRPGVPIDSGITFLPGNTPVDPETGSKYASEVRVIDGQEKRVMIEDSALIGSFVDWSKKLDDQSPLKQIFIDAYKSGSKGYYDEVKSKNNCEAAFIQELERLGIPKDTCPNLAHNLIREMYWSESLSEEALQGIVKKSGAHLKRATNTIPAQEYWESYFAKKPDWRPTHIQYYDGDPTTAVYEFQQQNNIGRADTSGTDGQLLGFDDNHVTNMGKDPRSNPGYNELVATANRLITEYYHTKTEQ